LRLDACTQARRRLDLVRGAPRECDRLPLLGKPIGELRRRSDACLERGTTLRRQRPVGKRSQLRDLTTVRLVLATTSHRHGNTNGNSERAAAWRGLQLNSAEMFTP
jgi:hypothetical protein